MTAYCLSSPTSRLSMARFFGGWAFLGVYFVKLKFDAVTYLIIYIAIQLTGFFVQQRILPGLMNLSPFSSENGAGLQFTLAACRIQHTCALSVALLGEFFMWVKDTAFAGHLGGAIVGAL